MLAVLLLGCGSKNDGTSSCETLCRRDLECGTEIALEQCRRSCDAQSDTFRICVAGCLDPTCEGWRSCVTSCGIGDQVGGDPYGSDTKACGATDAANVSCRSDVIACLVNVDPSTLKRSSVCTPFCQPPRTCPAPRTGTATAVCESTSVPGICKLDCKGGKVCPDGMICSKDAVFICVWPVN